MEASNQTVKTLQKRKDTHTGLMEKYIILSRSYCKCFIERYTCAVSSLLSRSFLFQRNAFLEDVPLKSLFVSTHCSHDK